MVEGANLAFFRLLPRCPPLPSRTGPAPLVLVSGLGFKVQGLGFRVEGLEITSSSSPSSSSSSLSGAWFRVQGLGVFGFRV